MEKYLEELRTNKITFVPFDEMSDVLSFLLDNSVFVSGGAYDYNESNVLGQFLYID